MTEYKAYHKDHKVSSSDATQEHTTKNRHRNITLYPFCEQLVFLFLNKYMGKILHFINLHELALLLKYNVNILTCLTMIRRIHSQWFTTFNQPNKFIHELPESCRYPARYARKSKTGHLQ